MKYLKLYESFTHDISEVIPTTKELFDMFTKINIDSEKLGQNVVHLSDIEYYTDQINNLYFNSDDINKSKEMAKLMSDYSKTH
jgi:hypothetical protein